MSVNEETVEVSLEGVSAAGIVRLKTRRTGDDSGQRFGITVSRGAMSFDDWHVNAGEGEFAVARYGTKVRSASSRAVQELAVVLLNTNEFVYVD